MEFRAEQGPQETAQGFLLDPGARLRLFLNKPQVVNHTTDLFVLCQGLRKSSEYSRNRKTIVPRCVPNMVCLHKYIVSEESVFLVLQHAEGWFVA